MAQRRYFDGIHAAPKRAQLRADVPLEFSPRNNRKRFSIIRNTIVTVVVTSAAGYFAFAPFIPNWVYQWQYRSQGGSPFVVKAMHSSEQQISSESATWSNQLLSIPTIGVESEILEGPDEETLDTGLWRRPNTSTPPQGGNTVIVAHRYKYSTGPNTFYYLDKVAVGEKLTVTWGKDVYVYRVTSTEVVSSNETGIEAQTSRPILTLYTCTPLWSSDKRLVVTAILDEVNGVTVNSH